MTAWTETTVNVAGVALVLIKGGSGRPLLILHDELGYTGWMRWNEALVKEHALLIPLQPGFGKTPRVEWIRSYRDLGEFYAMMVRDLKLDPVDVLGFSAGGFIAAEMAASDPKIFSRMILVGPMGLKPAAGEILDIFPLTVRSLLRKTVADPLHTPEFDKIYGGEMTPEQFEAFEDARIGWEPYMHSPSLPYLLQGVKRLPTLLIRGLKDAVVPHGCLDAYRRAIPHAKVTIIPGVGHRPEIEHSAEFIKIVQQFLAA